jgi:hypothetical protein
MSRKYNAQLCGDLCICAGCEKICCDRMVVRYAYQRCITCKSKGSAIVTDCATYRPKAAAPVRTDRIVIRRKSVDDRLKAIQEQLAELLKRIP